jgi:RNA polymerase sigma factor FliA
VGAALGLRSNSNAVRFADRDRILQEQLPQVRYIAQKIHSRLPKHIELEDLIQTGVLGLMEALRKYDPARRVELASFARHRIQGAILDSLREQDWSPRLLRQMARRAEEARLDLRARMGREPSDSELADSLGINMEAWHRMRTELQLLEVISLDALLSPEGHMNAACLPKSHAEDPFDLCTRTEWAALLHEAMAALTPRKKQALALYYAEGLTMKQVGARLGVCESRVSQMHTAALLILRLRINELLRCGLPSRPRRECERDDSPYATAEKASVEKCPTRKTLAEPRTIPRPLHRRPSRVRQSGSLRFRWNLAQAQTSPLFAP